MTTFQIVMITIAVVGLVITLGTIMWKIGKWSSSTDTRLDKLEESVERLEKSILASLKDLLKPIVSSLYKEVAVSKSPVGLTDYGEKLSLQVNAAEFVRKHAANVETRDDMNAYQIQEACFAYVDNDFLEKVSPEERDQLENIAFDEGIEVGKILKVIGIELRDVKLDEMGLNKSGIDG